MTMPRWWDNRFVLGLALASLAFNLGIHLIVLGSPTLVAGWEWTSFLYSIAFLLFHLIKDRSRRSSPPPAKKPAPTWRERAVQFAQMPPWAQAIRVLNYALFLYVLVLAVLSLARLFTHWSDGARLHLLLWSALASWISLDEALTAAKGLGWWGRWAAQR
jgi:hypothetical protein